MAPVKKIGKFSKEHPACSIVFVFLVSFVVLFLRRPDALLTPQFWAEDGKFWYGDAYNKGFFISMLRPYAGSLQIAMRFFASISLLLPLSYVPLFFTLIAFTIKILPVALLYTPRFSKIIPNKKAKFLVCAFYLLIPGGYEVHANLTNINWHLVLLCFMVVVAEAKTSLRWRLFDYATLFLSGLTGPFSIILSAVAFLNFKQHKTLRNKKVLLILLCCAAAQFLVLILGSSSARSSYPLQPSLTLLFEIIGLRIGASTIIGVANAVGFTLPPSGAYVILGILVLTITIAAYIKSGRQLRLFIILSWAMLAAALVKPIASDTIPQWYALLIGAGARYFFIPTICFFTCLVFLAGSKGIPRTGQVIACLLVFSSFAISIPKDFRYEKRQDLHFKDYSERVKSVPSGSTYCIPINPDWEMCLDKK